MGLGPRTSAAARKATALIVNYRANNLSYRSDLITFGKNPAMKPSPLSGLPWYSLTFLKHINSVCKVLSISKHLFQLHSLQFVNQITFSSICQFKFCGRPFLPPTTPVHRRLLLTTPSPLCGSPLWMARYWFLCWIQHDASIGKGLNEP